MARKVCCAGDTVIATKAGQWISSRARENFCMRGLSEKVVIVTGGGGGIGTAPSQRFVQEGAKVAVFDIDADSAGRTAAQITEAGGKAEAFACDITEYSRSAARRS